MIIIFYKIVHFDFFFLQRSQMEEAQDMFRNANKVTRPEKALILGFMAGSRGKLKIKFFS